MRCLSSFGFHITYHVQLGVAAAAGQKRRAQHQQHVAEDRSQQGNLSISTVQDKAHTNTIDKQVNGKNRKMKTRQDWKMQREEDGTDKGVKSTCTIRRPWPPSRIATHETIISVALPNDAVNKPADVSVYTTTHPA